MGEVHRARDAALGRDVALKILRAGDARVMSAIGALRDGCLFTAGLRR